MKSLIQNIPVKQTLINAIFRVTLYIFDLVVNAFHLWYILFHVDRSYLVHGNDFNNQF